MKIELVVDMIGEFLRIRELTVYKKIDFYLSALERHFSSPHPEAKLSVLYQYTYLAGQAKETQEHHQKYMTYLTKFQDIQKQIPTELLKEQQRKLNSEGRYMPLIPKAYFANHVLRATYKNGCENGFDEMSDEDHVLIRKFAMDELHKNFDLKVYADEDFDKQFMIDIIYIAYEWFLYTREFKKNQHRSYQELQDNPYGPYLPYYRMPAPLKAMNIDEPEMTKLPKVSSSSKMMQQLSASSNEVRSTSHGLSAGSIPQDLVRDEMSDDEFEPLELYSTDKPMTETETFLHEMMDTQNMTALSAWMQRDNLGDYVEHCFLDNKALLLVHSQGAVIFFPPEVFHRFDIEIPIKHLSLPGQENQVTLEGYGYYSYRSNGNIRELISFAEKYFLGNQPYLVKEQSYQTHGSYIRSPNSFRPFRISLMFSPEVMLLTANADYTYTKPSVDLFISSSDIQVKGDEDALVVKNVDGNDLPMRFLMGNKALLTRKPPEQKDVTQESDHGSKNTI